MWAHPRRGRGELRRWGGIPTGAAVPGSGCLPALCRALLTAPPAKIGLWGCRHGRQGLNRLGWGFPEQKHRADPAWDGLCVREGAGAEVQGVQPLWEDPSHPKGGSTTATGSRSSPRAGVTPGEGGTRGSGAVIPAFPPPPFAPQVCSQSPLPALLREVQRPSLSTIPPQQHNRGLPGWLGTSWWPHVLHGSSDTTSQLSLEVVTAAGSPRHRAGAEGKKPPGAAGWRTSCSTIQDTL